MQECRQCRNARMQTMQTMQAMQTMQTMQGFFKQYIFHLFLWRGWGVGLLLRLPNNLPFTLFSTACSFNQI